MYHIPQFLGIFTDIYGKNATMDIPKTLLISLIGFLTVILVLAIIAVFVRLISLVFSIFAKKADKQPQAAPAPAATPAPVQAPVKADPQLINVDEKTAAVVMAIVSHESGIPLNRLEFKSIKLMEDKK